MPKVTDTPEAIATLEVTTVPTATSMLREEPEKLAAAGNSITEVVVGYFNAADMLSAFVDQLIEEDKAAMETKQLIKS